MKLIKFYILIITTLSTIKSYSQINFEIDFLLDSTKTIMKEYKYSNSTYKSERYVIYEAVKNIEANIVSEKYYHSYDNGYEWTISKYDKNWKILEEIELNSDSTIFSKEVFNYLDSRIKSITYDSKGIVDSLTNMFYFPNGMQSGYKFIFLNQEDESWEAVEGNFQIDSLENYKLKLYYEQTNNSERVLKSIEEFIYNSDHLISITEKNSDGKIISNKDFIYSNGILTETISIGDHGEEREYFFYLDDNTTSIIGYSNMKNVIEPETYLKIIELK